MAKTIPIVQASVEVMLRSQLLVKFSGPPTIITTLLLLLPKDDDVGQDDAGTIGDTINNKTLLDKLQESEDLQHLNDCDITVGVEVFEDDEEDIDEDVVGNLRDNRKQSTSSLVSLRTCGTVQTEKVSIFL